MSFFRLLSLPSSPQIPIENAIHYSKKAASHLRNADRSTCPRRLSLHPAARVSDPFLLDGHFTPHKPIHTRDQLQSTDNEASYYYYSNSTEWGESAGIDSSNVPLVPIRDLNDFTIPLFIGIRPLFPQGGG